LTSWVSSGTSPAGERLGPAESEAFLNLVSDAFFALSFLAAAFAGSFRPSIKASGSERYGMKLALDEFRDVLVQAERSERKSSPSSLGAFVLFFGGIVFNCVLVLGRDGFGWGWDGMCDVFVVM
jgi:hypothetical protein